MLWTGWQKIQWPRRSCKIIQHFDKCPDISVPLSSNPGLSATWLLQPLSSHPMHFTDMGCYLLSKRNRSGISNYTKAVDDTEKTICTYAHTPLFLSYIEELTLDIWKWSSSQIIHSINRSCSTLWRLFTLKEKLSNFAVGIIDFVAATTSANR